MQIIKVFLLLILFVMVGFFFTIIMYFLFLYFKRRKKNNFHSITRYIDRGYITEHLLHNESIDYDDSAFSKKYEETLANDLEMIDECICGSNIYYG